MLVVKPPAETVSATVVLGLRNVRYGAWKYGVLRAADCGCRPTNFGGTCCCEGLRHCGLANSATAPYTAAVFGSRGSPVGLPNPGGVASYVESAECPMPETKDEWDGLAYEPGSVTCGGCPPPGGDHPSRSTVAGALKRPTRTLGRAALDRALSGLAPGGVYLAAPVARRAGGLLHRRFTLTRCCTRQPWRSIFCGTCLRVSPSGRYPPPCPAEPGLSSADVSSQTRPTRSPSQPVPPSGYGLLPRRQ